MCRSYFGLTLNFAKGTPLLTRLGNGYRGDRRLARGCSKGLISVGSRVIPYKKSVLNMVEVECPLCTSTVDLGSNATGTYECPYCHEDF